jgi:hypothetical protein
MYEDRNYVIFNISEVDIIDFDQVLETSSETLRISVDGTRSFVKWEGEMPECVSTLGTKEGPYSHEEILDILNGPDWTSPMEEI